MSVKQPPSRPRARSGAAAPRRRAPPAAAPAEASAAAPEALRKVPAQDRSRQRVERILDAAAEVFAASGYEAATTEAIAARAGTSIGSLYQFFPNKLSVFHALARRYHFRVRELYDQLVTPEVLDTPWPELLERTIDAFYAFHRADPGFRAVWLSFMLTNELVAAGDALGHEFTQRTEQVLARQLPHLPAARRALIATMVVEVITAMLIVSARRGDADGERIIAETKVLMRRYLEPFTTSPAALSPETERKRKRKRKRPA